MNRRQHRYKSGIMGHKNMKKNENTHSHTGSRWKIKRKARKFFCKDACYNCIKTRKNPWRHYFHAFFFSFFLFLADDTTVLLHVWFLLCQLPMKKGPARGFDEVPHVGFIGKLKNKICLQHLYPPQIYGLQTVLHHSQNTGHPQIPLSRRPDKEPHFNNTHPHTTGHNRVWPWIIIIIIIWEIKQRHWYAGRHHPVTQLWPQCVSAWWVAPLQSPSYLPESLSTFWKEYLWGHWVTIVGDSINHTPISPVPMKLSFLYRYLNIIILIMMFPRFA